LDEIELNQEMVCQDEVYVQCGHFHLMQHDIPGRELPALPPMRGNPGGESKSKIILGVSLQQKQWTSEAKTYLNIFRTSLCLVFFTKGLATYDIRSCIR